MLVGGYPSFHQQPGGESSEGEQREERKVEDASPNKLDSIKNNFKLKSANLKESLINYIYNPNLEKEPKHIDFNKRGSKLYKNTGDVFCLEDEEEENLVSLVEVEKRADTVHLANCQRVGETGLLSPCHLWVTTSQLVVLTPGPRPGMVLPSSSRHLSSIVKITSKKRQPEIITFKFGTSQNDEVTVFDMDRFFIPTAGRVTVVVKTQIERLKE